MDKSKFGNASTGKLVAVLNRFGKPDWAFIPDKMPVSFEMPPELVPLLVEARARLGKLDGIGQTLENPDLLLHPLQLREAITSSSLEGTYVTPEKFFEFELTEHSKKPDTSERQDWKEVHNYRASLVRGQQLIKKIPFCNRLILQMHTILMRGVRGGNQPGGDFRKHQVQIGSNARFIPPPPSEVPRLMNDLEFYMNMKVDIDPLVKAYLIHYQIETIHPFIDGNGRVGRAMLAMMIYSWLGHSLPWLYMSAYYEHYKNEYTEKLFNISANGQWRDWLEFSLRGTIMQAEDSIRRCDAFRALKEEFHNKIRGEKLATSRTHEIIDFLFKQPAITIPTLRKNWKITQPTARAEIDRLMKVGILAEIQDRTRPKIFYSSQIMQVAHDDTSFPPSNPSTP